MNYVCIGIFEFCLSRSLRDLAAKRMKRCSFVCEFVAKKVRKQKVGQLVGLEVLDDSSVLANQRVHLTDSKLFLHDAAEQVSERLAGASIVEREVDEVATAFARDHQLYEKLELTIAAERAASPIASGYCWLDLFFP